MCGVYHVRLDDGTCWSIDREHPTTETSLEWTLRYGRDADVLKERLVIASILASYKALVSATQRRRNEVARALQWASEQASTEQEKKNG